MLQVLDPSMLLTFFPSLPPLASRFHFLISVNDLESFDGEWRHSFMAELPFDKEDMDPEEFWSKLDKITGGLGNPQSSILCKFMKILLCMPTSNVDVERIFADLSNIKTKLRNKLHSTILSPPLFFSKF